MEIARDKGKATGNVSTAEITDATPAGPSSHISQRGCHGPADTRTTCPSEAKTAATPGLGSIAEQQVDEDFDVYLGGGRARYQQTLTAAGPTTVVDYAQSNGYTVVNDKAGMDAITSLAGGAKLLGLFHPSNMTTEFAAAAGDDAPGSGSATTRCTENNRPANEPSLSAMTKKAIQLLDDDDDGFVLQVEGASIDKRDHAADVCGQIGELLEFDNAIGEALDFQADNPDTLIIVTADHAHTSQIINSGQVPATGASYATVQTRRRRADARQLRHGQHAGRLAGPHRRRGAGLGGGPAGGEHPGDDRSDGHLRRPQRPDPQHAGHRRRPGPGRSRGAGRPGGPGRYAGSGRQLGSGRRTRHQRRGRHQRRERHQRPERHARRQRRGGHQRHAGSRRRAGQGRQGRSQRPRRQGQLHGVALGQKGHLHREVLGGDGGGAARLTRRGRVVARGRLARGKVTFASKRKLGRGAYTLVAAGRKTSIVIR